MLHHICFITIHIPFHTSPFFLLYLSFSYSSLLGMKILLISILPHLIHPPSISYLNKTFSLLHAFPPTPPYVNTPSIFPLLIFFSIPVPSLPSNSFYLPVYLPLTPSFLFQPVFLLFSHFSYLPNKLSSFPPIPTAFLISYPLPSCLSSFLTLS